MIDMLWRRNNLHHMQRPCGRPFRAALRGCALVLAANLAAYTGVCPAAGQETNALQREYNVKAVSLYAFGRYVTWPKSAFASDSTPLVIGLYGGNPFGDALSRIAAKKTVNGRPIVVKQLEAPQDSTSCHIVFIARTAPSELEAQIIKSADAQPVLLVGESPGFARRGGIINFYHSGANIRFEVNPQRSEACQLSLDARLLSLGTKAQAE
jgi:hypothetical protein